MTKESQQTETKEINGITFVKDANGNWAPQNATSINIGSRPVFKLEEGVAFTGLFEHKSTETVPVVDRQTGKVERIVNEDGEIVDKMQEKTRLMFTDIDGNELFIFAGADLRKAFADVPNNTLVTITREAATKMKNGGDYVPHRVEILSASNG